MWTYLLFCVIVTINNGETERFFVIKVQKEG